MFFFFNDTATTEIYTLALHDALPICHHADHHRDHDQPLRTPAPGGREDRPLTDEPAGQRDAGKAEHEQGERSEEHTSELQSRQYLVCRLLLEKKKRKINLSTSRIDHE